MKIIPARPEDSVVIVTYFRGAEKDEDSEVETQPIIAWAVHEPEEEHGVDQEYWATPVLIDALSRNQFYGVLLRNGRVVVPGEGTYSNIADFRKLAVDELRRRLALKKG